MVAMNPRIGRAMSEQLERVNHTPERLQERIRELEKQNDLLRARLRLYEQRDGSTVDAPQMFNGRPVITPNDAASRTWTSRSTVNRYLTSGYWQGVQVSGSNRWWVYADQPLTKKQGRKKQ